MDRKEFQELLAEGLKPINEKITAIEAKASAAEKNTTVTAAAAAAGDDKIVKLIESALKPVTEKLGVFETAQAASATASAKSAVMAHVGRGAIAPADTETINFFAAAYAKDAEGTEKILAKLPGRQFTRVITTGGGTTTVTGGEPEHLFMAKAKEFAKTHDIKGSAAEVMSAYASTAEGRDLYTQFRAKIVPKK